MAQLRLFGRALFSPLLRLGRSYDEVAKKWPQATALVTTTLKTSAADAFAQLVRWRDGVGVFWRAVHGCHPSSRHVTSQDLLAVSFTVLTTSSGSFDAAPRWWSKGMSWTSSAMQCSACSGAEWGTLPGRTNWLFSRHAGQPLQVFLAGVHECLCCMLHHAGLPTWATGRWVQCLRVVDTEIDCSAATDDSYCRLRTAQYYLSNVLFARWCKHITKVVGHLGSAPVKTFLDQAIQ